MKVKIQQANLSDVGKNRKENEDYYGSFNIQDLEIFIVSDGMGGYKGGLAASHIVVDSVREYFEQKYKKNENIIQHIKLALEQADLRVKQKADEDIELKNMGATVVLLIIRDDKAYIAHIGDSRAYIIRDKKINKITKDHSLVQQMVDGGIITEEQAKNHPKRNIITHSLGHGGKSDVEIQEPLQLFKDDILILCTDGLTGHVEDFEIQNITLENEPITAVHKLIDLANDRGGKDNITVQIVKIISGKSKPIDQLIIRKIKNYFFYAVIGLIAIAAIIVIISLSGILNKDVKSKKNTPNALDSTSNITIDSLANASYGDSVNFNNSDGIKSNRIQKPKNKK